MKKTISILTAILIITGLMVSSSNARSIDDEVREISDMLMCPICQGQTVAESKSELAEQMRTIIKKKLEAGESKEEIISYFVTRYGESILGAPPAKGVSLLLWITPFLALTIGILCIALYVLRWAPQRREEKVENVENVRDEAQPEYLEKLDKELKEFEL